MSEISDKLKNEGKLLYSYMAGSHLYGLNTPESDIDEKGVYAVDWKEWNSLHLDYADQVADKKNDVVYYEAQKYAKLLLTSNPTVLEALFAPASAVYYEHPLFTELRDKREIFLTKKAFASFGGYAVSQLHKMRGLNKMIVKPMVERKGILDFTYTFYNQGSTVITNWLNYRALEQRYCGLVNIPNMHDIYGCYYDWGAYWEDHNITIDTYSKIYSSKTPIRLTADIVADIKSENGDVEALQKELWESQLRNQLYFIIDHYRLECADRGGVYSGDTFENFRDWYNKHNVRLDYRGLIKEGDGVMTTELRLTSVSKGEIPICWVSYNEQGFSKHCVDYRNFKEWEKNRNPVRYQSNLNKNYDAKNASHCMRLINMCIELANGEGFNVDRRDIDRDFLLDIKNHKFEYDELMEILTERQRIMDEAIAKSNLPDSIDVNVLNEWLWKVRQTF